MKKLNDRIMFDKKVFYIILSVCVPQVFFLLSVVFVNWYLFIIGLGFNMVISLVLVVFNVEDEEDILEYLFRYLIKLSLLSSVSLLIGALIRSFLN